MKDLWKIRQELTAMLIKKSDEQIRDGSSEAFTLGVSSGFFDAAAIVHNYFIDMEKEEEGASS